MNMTTTYCLSRLAQASLQDLLAVGELLAANGGHYIDDHTGKRSTKPAAAIGLHVVRAKDGSVRKSTVVLLHEGDPHSYPYYCVNDMSVQDGQVHLSRNANGTVTQAAGRSIEQHVRAYNTQHDPEIYNAQITHLTRL